MKRHHPLLRLFLPAIALLLPGCQRHPVADFDMSTETAMVGETVSFSNKSLHADHFEWDFGDGRVSTAADPAHAYVASGAYDVELTAFSKNGQKWDTKTRTISVALEQGRITQDAGALHLHAGSCEAHRF